MRSSAHQALARYLARLPRVTTWEGARGWGEGGDMMSVMCRLVGVIVGLWGGGGGCHPLQHTLMLGSGHWAEGVSSLP